MQRDLQWTDNNIYECFMEGTVSGAVKRLHVDRMADALVKHSTYLEVYGNYKTENHIEDIFFLPMLLCRQPGILLMTFAPLRFNSHRKPQSRSVTKF